MIQILTVVAPLFLIIFASALLQRFEKVGENWSAVLNEFALKIGLPVLVFCSLAKASFSMSAQKGLLLSNSIFIVGTFLVAFALGKMVRLRQQAFRTFFMCLAFGNTAYLGIPVLVQLAGESILPTASLIVALYLFWMFTLGIGFLGYAQQRKREVLKSVPKDLLKNPLLVAVLLGILVASLRIPLPAIALKSLDMVTASVTPTVLIVIGLFIGKSKIGKLKEWVPVLLFSILKLLALPAGFYLGLRLLGFAPASFSASLIQAAMPLAITPFALSEKYGLNKEFVARSIVLSTILSVVSIPFWVSVL